MNTPWKLGETVETKLRLEPRNAKKLTIVKDSLPPREGDPKDRVEVLRVLGAHSLAVRIPFEALAFPVPPEIIDQVIDRGPNCDETFSRTIGAYLGDDNIPVVYDVTVDLPRFGVAQRVGRLLRGPQAWVDAGPMAVVTTRTMPLECEFDMIFAQGPDTSA